MRSDGSSVTMHFGGDPAAVVGASLMPWAAKHAGQKVATKSSGGAGVTLDEFFTGYEASRPLFDALRAVVDSLGDAELRVTKSQVAFSDRRTFAWAWVPDRYLGGGHAPLVLSVALQERNMSPRWKQIVEPSPGRFVHHLELRSESDLDDEVLAWLRDARSAAG